MSGDDPEITAMGEIASSLSPLDEAARSRVLKWAAARYADGGLLNDQPRTAVDEVENEPHVSEEVNYTEFAEAFNDYDPKDDDEKVLIAAYWVQIIEGNEKWSSIPVNKHLRNTGHSISHISRVLKRCSERKPAPLLILAKNGKNQQAKKTHKLTSSGIADIEKRLKSSAQ